MNARSVTAKRVSTLTVIQARRGTNTRSKRIAWLLAFIAFAPLMPEDAVAQSYTVTNLHQ